MEKITINGVEYKLTPVENKTVNKIEPKFKVGNWYQCTKDFFGKGVTFDKNTAYYCAKEGCLQDEYGCHIAIVKDLYDNFKLWAIQDAKDGDVLAIDPWSDYPSSFVVIYKKQNEEDFDSYCFVGFDGKFYKGENGHSTEDIHPATKEQRDLLFQKMHEAGYEWDSEKKELKKYTPIFTVGDTIIKKPVSDINFGYFTITDIAGEKYWYNDRIICEISEQNDWELVKQKPAECESEENERMLDYALDMVEWYGGKNEKRVRLVSDWLKSLKPQPKQEWSEEDDYNLQCMIAKVVKDIQNGNVGRNNELIDWLKSIKNRIQPVL